MSHCIHWHRQNHPAFSSSSFPRVCQSIHIPFPKALSCWLAFCCLVLFWDLSSSQNLLGLASATSAYLHKFSEYHYTYFLTNSMPIYLQKYLGFLLPFTPSPHLGRKGLVSSLEVNSLTSFSSLTPLLLDVEGCSST